MDKRTRTSQPRPWLANQFLRVFIFRHVELHDQKGDAAQIKNELRPLLISRPVRRLGYDTSQRLQTVLLILVV